MKVFISHSSRDDPFAGMVREAVKLRLAGHEVLVDMDELRPGDEWRAVLYHWLAECHAAVVLLNREALASSWVRREVNILLWRRALGYPLKVVPAIIGDLATQDIRQAGFGELTDLQVARLGSARYTGEAAELLAGEIVDQLAGAPISAADDSAMASWAEAVSFALGNVGNRDSLVAAARELQVEETYLDRVRDPVEGPRFMAHQLLAREHRRLYLAIARIADFTPAEWLSRLIDKVGATWVDGEAARVLLTFGPGQPGTVVLNARSPKTAQQYVDRATCCAPTGFRCETVTAIAGESFLEEFEKECVKAVEKLLGVEPHFPLEEYMDMPPEDVLFLIVDPSSTRPELVAQGVRAVRSRFPWLIMMLLTGKTLPTDEVLMTWQLTDALRLEPALGLQEELSAHRINGALDKLRVTWSGPRMAGAA